LKNLFLPLFFVFFLNGCAHVDTSQKVAVDEFFKKSEQVTKDFTPKKEAELPPRTIVQFTYGPESLKNNDFLSYLILAKANVSPEIARQLKEQENQYLVAKSKDSTSASLIQKEILNLNKKVAIYKKFNKNTSININNSKLSKILDYLFNEAGIKAKQKFEDKKINAQFSGSAYKILNQIAEENHLSINFNKSLDSFEVNSVVLNGTDISEKYVTDNFNNDDFFNNLSKLEDDLKQLTSFISLNKGYDNSNKIVFKTEVAQTLLQSVVNVANRNTIISAKNDESSTLRKALLEYAEINELNHSTAPKTAAVFDPKLARGSEIVIEKFSVYNSPPDEMLKTLKGYSIFQNCAKTSTLKTPASAGANGATATSPTATSPTTTSPTTTSTTATNSDATKTTPTQNDNKTAVSVIADENKLTFQEDLKTVSGCVTFNSDATGIIASGSVVDIQLVGIFLSDQDLPRKQALIEVFIVEVTADWAQKMSGKVDKIDGMRDFIAGATTEFTNQASGFTLIPQTADKVRAFVSLLETNAVGRKVSNPIILVKDGEKGVVNKVVTRRAEIVSPATVSAGITQPATTTIKELPAPLTLTVTPTINKHNNNIDLDFNFTEENFDSGASVTSTTTKNEITSKLTIQPGQVVMLAGLKRENNSKSSKGIPGLSQLGLLSPLGALLGGDTDWEKSGSEILVFINPSVITNKNIGRTVNRVKDN